MLLLVKMGKMGNGIDLRKEKWGSPGIQESKLPAKVAHPVAKPSTCFYYIDTSVLLENTPVIKIHTKPHPGLGWLIFHTLASEDIDNFTDKVSGKIFSNVGVTFGQVLENFRKSSGKRRKRRHRYVYIIKETLHVSSKI